MIRFESDYLEGAHEAILDRLAASNRTQTPGYGLDVHCESARRLIRRECGTDGVEVHFLVGGTQANTVMLASILRPYQAAVSPDTGHIAGHETGAIEATGHKILTVPHCNGKINAADVRAVYDAHWGDSAHEHIPQPGLVYISHPTETGSIYSRRELVELSEVCRELGLPLVLDGARLGYGLTAPGTDVTIRDLAELCDMFTIGGTKVGALMGEAVVITNPSLTKDFRYHIKQRGGMLAKGRLLGIQFEGLFEGGLYYTIARGAVERAMRIKECLEELGVDFLHAPATNQLFAIFGNASLEMLGKRYSFSYCGGVGGDRSAVRICTSWATRDEDVDALLADLRSLPRPL